MARSDWNEFYFQKYPTAYFHLASNWTEIGAGQGSTCLKINGKGADTKDMFGFLYNGSGNSANGLIRDGSMSMAMRLPNTSFGNRSRTFGPIMRATTLYPNSPDTAQLWANGNCYVFGAYLDHTSDATSCQCRWYRILDGNLTSLFSAVAIPNYDAAKYWMQFETRLKNDLDGNVECWVRWNTGSAWSLPGVGSWSSWSLSGTDTGHNSVLNQAGYWGFGRLEAGAAWHNPYSTADMWAMVDQIMIARRIYD